MDQPFFRRVPDYGSVCRTLRSLLCRHKNLKMFPIGKSLLGRDISALCLGEPEGAALFVGATHGLEWLTTLLLLRFCDDLLHAFHSGGSYSDINVRKAFRSRSLVIIPCLNPDGVEIALHGSSSAGCYAKEVEQLCNGNHLCWQANARGVDLNHNFDAGWEILHKMEKKSGIHGPAPTRYGGPHPESEPESLAIATFCRTFQPRTLYSFHSQGEEIYYRYGPKTPSRSKMIAQILASSSGYKVLEPEGLASHGGLKDWFVEGMGKPGFTIEIGKGKNPLGLDQLDGIYEKTSEMMMLAALL